LKRGNNYEKNIDKKQTKLVRAHDGTYLNKNLRQGGSQGNVPQK
jgi:hypothetical protein